MSYTKEEEKEQNKLNKPYQTNFIKNSREIETKQSAYEEEMTKNAS